MTPPETSGARADPAVAAQPGLRERKKRATRAAVQDATLRLVVRLGLQNVTTDRIADEAGISARTFFNYFATKEEAIVAAATSGAELIAEAYRGRPASESVLEAMRAAVLSVVSEGVVATHAHVDALQMIRTSPSLVPYQLASLARHEAGLAEAIVERMAPQDEPDDMYPALCAAAALAALRIALDRAMAKWAGDRTTHLDGFRVDFDRALRRLASGLDHPGRG